MLVCVWEFIGTSARGATENCLIGVTLMAAATTPGISLDCGGRDVASSSPTRTLTGVVPAVEKLRPRIGRVTALPAHGEELNDRGSL
jgi:hypothetical protein